MSLQVLRHLNLSVMNKMGDLEYKVMYEHFYNLLFLSKKGRKSSGIIDAFCNQEYNEVSKVTPKELGLIQKLFEENLEDFLCLSYPTSYFKAAIIMKLYPIPLATLVVLMVWQRLGYFETRTLILFVFFFVVSLLLVQVLLDFILGGKIKKSRLYACYKAVAQEHRLNNSVMSNKLDGSAKRPSSNDPRPTKRKEKKESLIKDRDFDGAADRMELKALMEEINLQRTVQ